MNGVHPVVRVNREQLRDRGSQILFGSTQTIRIYPENGNVGLILVDPTTQQEPGSYLPSSTRAPCVICTRNISNLTGKNVFRLT